MTHGVNTASIYRTAKHGNMLFEREEAHGHPVEKVAIEVFDKSQIYEEAFLTSSLSLPTQNFPTPSSFPSLIFQLGRGARIDRKILPELVGGGGVG